MVVNRLDYKVLPPSDAYANGGVIGVGASLMELGEYEPDEVALGKNLLTSRRRHHGDSVLAIDVGANIGVMTIPWARHMRGWGRVIALEPQAPIYYALCANVILNNLHDNVTCLGRAAGRRDTEMLIEIPDYNIPGCFGGFDIAGKADLGQPKTDKKAMIVVRRLDTLVASSPHVDFIKIDVEGMESDVLTGAREILERHRPILLIEHILVTDKAPFVEGLKSIGYEIKPVGMNWLAIHNSDHCANDIVDWKKGLL